MVLSHLLACPWGSIISGHRLALFTKIPFSVEKLSLGSPYNYQFLILTGSPKQLIKSNLGDEGTSSDRQ